MKNIETHFTTWKKKNLFHSLFHQQVHSRHYLQLRTQLIEFVKGGVLTSKGKSNWIEEKKKNEKNIHSQNPEKSQARSHVHCITQENLSLPNTHSQTHSLATVRKSHKKNLTTQNCKLAGDPPPQPDQQTTNPITAIVLSVRGEM